MKTSPKLATHHARAGDQLAAHMGVRTVETADGVVFIYKERTIATATENEVRLHSAERLPKRVARALGHFLVNAAREQR